MKLPIAATVVVVVEADGRFLMIEEDRGAGTGPVWYFPSGALEAGESLAQSARRETLEETGYAVEPVALIALDHGAFREPDGLFWWRFTISARLEAREPRDIDENGIITTAWLSIDQIQGLRLRNQDVVRLCERRDSGFGLALGACHLSVDGTLQGFFM